MADLFDRLARGDVSVLVALLLVALLAALKWIGNGLIKRIEVMEQALEAFDRIQQRHTTSLAVVKTRLEIVEDESDLTDRRG